MRSRPDNSEHHAGEQGFMLVGLIVAIFLILLALSVAAPTVAKQLRREREVEAVHRGNQYVRAIRQYYLKTGHYPGSMEQLEKTSNIRYLRQRYVDPMTGKADWKLIHVGEAKTTVKAFFGQPLAGIAGSSGGLGSAAGLASSGQGAQSSVNGAGGSSSSFGSSSFGSSSSGSSSFGSSSSSPGSSSGSSGLGSSSGPGSSSPGSSSFGSSSGSSGSSTPGSPGVSSQSATSLTGTGAPIMGVGSAATGTSIVVLNEQTTYPAWEFIYDPRIEQLKAKSNSLGGGSLGSASSSASGFGSSASGFGQGTGSSAGGSGFGTSTPGTSGAPTPAPSPQ